MREAICGTPVSNISIDLFEEERVYNLADTKAELKIHPR